MDYVESSTHENANDINQVESLILFCGNIRAIISFRGFKQMDNSISLTVDDAIKKKQAELNTANNAFDRWASQNPLSLDDFNMEFREQKQSIKLLRLEINDLKEMKFNYQNTLLFKTSRNMVKEPVFSKSRNSNIFSEKTGNKLGKKKTNQISQG